MGLFDEIWASVRPNVVQRSTAFLNEMLKYLYDFLIACAIWGLLVAFHYVTTIFSASGYTAKLLLILHNLGVIAAMANLVWSIVNDIIQSKTGGAACLA